jgi:hypothetical protein
MLKTDPNAAIRNELIGYNSVDDCGNPSISQLTYPQGLRNFETEHVMDSQLIASFLADTSNGVLRSGAMATTAQVSMSYFVHAQTAPIINAPLLPDVGDPNMDTSLRRLFPCVIECLGTKTNTATFVSLKKNTHRAKTLVSVPSFAIPQLQTLTCLFLYR